MSRLLSVAAVAVSVGCGAATTEASPASIRPVRIPRTAVVGVAWRGILAVDAGERAPTVVATGPRRISAKAQRVSERRFRVSITFPQPGRWLLVARSGRTSASLGTVTVDARPTPLLADVFALAVEPQGTLLIGQVHNGGVVRATVDGSTTRVVSDVSVFHLSVGTAGTAYVTLHDNGGVFRVTRSGNLEPLGFPGDAGIAVEAGDGVYALHGKRLLRRGHDGDIAVVADGLSNPLGLGVGPGGNVYVADAGTGTIEEARTGTTVARGLGYVVSVAIAPDGTIWSASVTDGGPSGVWRTDSAGASTRVLDKEVSAVALGGDGAVYACAFRERRILRLDPATNRWETILRSR